MRGVRTHNFTVSSLDWSSLFTLFVQVNLCQKLLFLHHATNPQYDHRLFSELQVQYMKIPSSNLGRTRCVQKLFLIFRIFFCTQHVLPMLCKKKSFWQRFTCNSWIAWILMRGTHLFQKSSIWIIKSLHKMGQHLFKNQCHYFSTIYFYCWPLRTSGLENYRLGANN